LDSAINFLCSVSSTLIRDSVLLRKYTIANICAHTNKKMNMRSIVEYFNIYFYNKAI
jgi:hypothetical protein